MWHVEFLLVLLWSVHLCVAPLESGPVHGKFRQVLQSWKKYFHILFCPWMGWVIIIRTTILFLSYFLVFHFQCLEMYWIAWSFLVGPFYPHIKRLIVSFLIWYHWDSNSLQLYIISVKNWMPGTNIIIYKYIIIDIYLWPDKIFYTILNVVNLIILRKSLN